MTKIFLVKRGPYVGDYHLYSEKGVFLKCYCVSQWERFTGIKLDLGTKTKIKITFKRVKK